MGSLSLLDADLLKRTAVFGQVSGELIGSVGGGYLLGKWLDAWLHLTPWFSAGLASLGLACGVWRISKQASGWMKASGKEK